MSRPAAIATLLDGPDADARLTVTEAGAPAPPAAVEATIERWLARYDRGPVALGELLCDEHPEDALALVCEGPDGVERLSYGELGERSRRLAGALHAAGVGPGDCVAVASAGASPELVVALLALLRAGAVPCPGAGRELDVCALAAASAAPFDGVPRAGGDPLMVVPASGSSAAVEVPVRALAAIRAYLHYGLDVRPEDVFWNMAGPTSPYGLLYGIVGPLLLGHPLLLRRGRFDAAGAFATILAHGVTNLAGTPSAFHALRIAGLPDGFRGAHRLGAVSCAGGPPRVELLTWSARELGVAIHDHHGLRELGMIAGFAQHHEVHRQPLPGSIGAPLPGFRAVVVGADGAPVDVGADGELALDVERSPLLWFRGYVADAVRTAERFRHGARWCLTGERAWLGDDGLLRLVGGAGAGR